MQENIPLGTIRVKTLSLKPYVMTKNGWKRCKSDIDSLLQTVNLFKAHNLLDVLVDKKNPLFLKGLLGPDGKCKGARLNILPDGRKLDKSYSLFAKNLTIHDELSNEHWDVIYQNVGGTYSYLYTPEKIKRNRKQKYRKVKEFDKYHKTILKNAEKCLNNKKDDIAVPMYTLLKTYMRIGNEIYHKLNGHKGLTTLTAGDISIDKNCVEFAYRGKDGVPINIKEPFTNNYIHRLKENLAGKRKNEFVFVDTQTGHPFHDTHFMKAFKKYCGKEFYPHIVRSHFATKKVETFLNFKDKYTMKDVKELFLEIAEKLGHKKFNKKKEIWEDSFTVTVNHYIEPSLVEKLKKNCQ